MLSTPSGRTAKTATGCGPEQQQTAAATAKQPLPASGYAARGPCRSSRRRGCGTRALVELLAAAALVQFAALAGGGSWLLLRLSALEARHEQMRANGCAGPGAATPAQVHGNEYHEALSSGGGGASAAYVDAVGDVTFDHKRQGDIWSRFARKRSAGDDGNAAQEAAAAAATTARPATEAAAAEQLADESDQHGLAHFVFQAPRDDEFQLDASLSRLENYTTMVPRPGYTASILSNDRWYPRMLRYYSASGKLVFLARAPWLDEWNADATARATALGEITVSHEGLYLIYAQVCFTNRVSLVTGFVIKKRTVSAMVRGAERRGEGSGLGEHPRDEYIAACETYSSVGVQPDSPTRRFTCSVTTMHHLTPRDRLSIELHSARHIYVRHDFTYVGLVRMA